MDNAIRKKKQKEIGSRKLGYREQKPQPFSDDQTGYLDAQEKQLQSVLC